MLLAVENDLDIFLEWNSLIFVGNYTMQLMQKVLQ